ncbi:5-oxoprolinase subunit PxpB [Paraglaciecola sp.]|uniref:5-oxoprolinase subunit PxpB n=1 Tax=Paraglaciecola sp. TaxID=1920173 RepID=UPI003EF545F7
MTQGNYQLVTNGDSGITILFKQEISQLLSRRISALAKLCEQEFAAQLSQVIPAYQSLTLCYLPDKISFKVLWDKLELMLQNPIEIDRTQSRKIVIPVCYESAFSLDMHTVTQHTQLTRDEIIQKHTQTEYFVHMLGFSPGFLYLGGMSDELSCPRKSSPDLKVPAGSVGIGGAQTGIYPHTSPGGWQIIGQTPFTLFDINRAQPCIAQALDVVIFESITGSQYQELKREHS